MQKHHWALISLGVNLTQTSLKFIAGMLTGSLSLIGEAFHSLSDSLASVIAFLSTYVSQKKHPRFPYGLYKVENLGSLAIGVFLIMTAYEIAHRALTSQVTLNEEFLPLGIGVVVLSGLSSLTLSILERRAGKRLNSPTLVADSYHTLTDTLGSAVVLASLISAYAGYNLDRYFALMVSALILYTAFSMIREQIAVILDVSVDKETLDKIKELILSFPEVDRVDRLLVRSAGGKMFVDAVISLKAGNLVRGHLIADEIEKRIYETFEQVEMVFIHYEPASKDKIRVGVLTDDAGRVCSRFASAKYLYIFSEGEGEPKKVSLSGGDEAVAKTLVREGVDIVVCGHHPEDSLAKWILHRNGIFVWETEKENIYEALSEISRIKELEAPKGPEN